MHVDLTLFWVLIVILILLSAICVISQLALREHRRTITRMGNIISDSGKNNALLQSEATHLRQEEKRLEKSVRVGHEMVTALSLAADADRARLNQALVDGVCLYSVLGAGLAFHQWSLEDATNMLVDLGVGEQAFAAAFTNAYLAWPGETLTEDDYTPEIRKRAQAMWDVLGFRDEEEVPALPAQDTQAVGVPA